jgi:hypothetical protein
MRKSLILALTAFGSGATYPAVAAESPIGPSVDNPTTWRWHVSSILDAQSRTNARGVEVGVLGPEAFNQRYERFTPLGLHQPRGDSR